MIGQLSNILARLQASGSVAGGIIGPSLRIQGQKGHVVDCSTAKDAVRHLASYDFCSSLTRLAGRFSEHFLTWKASIMKHHPISPSIKPVDENNLWHRNSTSELIEVGRDFYVKNWLSGTSGNLSTRPSDDSSYMIITASGCDKGKLSPSDFVKAPLDGRAEVSGLAVKKPSGETQVHSVIYQNTDACSVIHVHSVPALLIAEICAEESAFIFSNLEVLKGLGAGSPHERVRIPIVENFQEMERLAEEIVRQMQPSTIAVLIRHHGLFVWGPSISTTKRYVELLHHVFEYFLEKKRLQIEG